MGIEIGVVLGGLLENPVSICFEAEKACHLYNAFAGAFRLRIEDSGLFRPDSCSRPRPRSSGLLF